MFSALPGASLEAGHTQMCSASLPTAELIKFVSIIPCVDERPAACPVCPTWLRGLFTPAPARHQCWVPSTALHPGQALGH